MAGIMVVAAIPAGRRLISQVRGEPTKWLMATAGAARIGAMRRAQLGTRLVSRHKGPQHGHGGPSYVALVGVAAGVVTLVCFYLCVWLVRHQRRQRTPAARQLPLAPLPHHHHNAHQAEGFATHSMDSSAIPKTDKTNTPGSGFSHDYALIQGDRPHEMKTARPRGDSDSATQIWSSESVELVVMAGEHVPTFVAHPVVQYPAPPPNARQLSPLT